MSILHHHARRRLAGSAALAPVYPTLPLYFESYSGQNDMYRWQNMGTLGGYMNTRGNINSPGRMLTSEALPLYTIPSGSAYDPWDIPNVSAGASDYTFYLLLRGTTFDTDNFGGYIIDWQQPPGGGDRTILGYAGPQGTAEIGTFYQSGQFTNMGAAPRAPVDQLKIFTWVLQNGQPVRVYDETDALLFSSSFNYLRVALNGLGQPIGAGNLSNQSLGTSIGSGRPASADFGGFALDTVAHTTKAQRDAVRAKWRQDLNF
ncbi:hypothetical protein [Hymenobacter sp. BT559]|uniref:hypothetical protein n=1 Tax=Hymenobacter sp. BT559 TaxID=2795729 RepID=UPI0018EA3CAD|nr:hypothetical protein [Hymenobacter sp. BT559]MBJ6145747.1 hypothetical protein [Hymenobacter sp. BT559]